MTGNNHGPLNAADEFRDTLDDGQAKENRDQGPPTLCDFFIPAARGRGFTAFDGAVITFIRAPDKWPKLKPADAV